MKYIGVCSNGDFVIVRMGRPTPHLEECWMASAFIRNFWGY